MDVYVCLTVVLFFISVYYTTEGLDSCRDLEPCSEFHVNCANPGIPHLCMRTCNACRTLDVQEPSEPSGPRAECTMGHVEVNNECRPCSEQSWQVIMTNRECSPKCPQGHWGPTCRKACSVNCFWGTCERWSGQCEGGCVDRYYGPYCQLHCRNCGFHGRCHLNGECIHGCQAGWTGKFCLVPN